MTAMKRIYKISVASAVVLGSSLVFSSCSMESPFVNEGEGQLSIEAEMRGDVVVNTRAIDDDEMSRLRENCTIWLIRKDNSGSDDSGSKIVKRFKGLDNIPESFSLKVGNYIADAWAGDSVTASFDKKFYRAVQPFEIKSGENKLTVECKLANVVVSIKPESFDVGLKNMKVTVSNSRGQLEFNSENVSSEKGYFMMPNAKDTDISYKIEGLDSRDVPFKKEGKIENVQCAHEYVMSITENEAEITQGGALIKISIEDIPIIDTKIDVFPAPVPRGVDFDIEEQVVSTDRNFSDIKVYFCGFKGLQEINANFSDNFGFSNSEGNIISPIYLNELNAYGIDVQQKESSQDAYVDGGKVKVDEVYVTFSKSFLDNLPVSDSEFKVDFIAKDGSNHVGIGSLRIANSLDAVDEVPLVVPGNSPDPDNEPMSITATTATLTGYIYDIENAKNYGIEYRASGDSDWIKAYPSSGSGMPANIGTRADNKPFTVTIKGLQAGTTYEYRVFSDGFTGNDILKFTTEQKFVIPNASFEDWTTYSASTLLGTKTVQLPGSTGDKLTSFWGSGNEGAATANKTLTTKSEDMRHSGQYSARLGSDAALGIIAAGNIFVGHYVKTDGTNGVLSLGREYNGSHPSKVRVYANYRPGGEVTIKDGNESLVEITKGGTDHGQIYIALTDEPVEIRTNPDDRKLFDANDSHVLAYGEQTWTSNFGADGTLEVVEIPFTYNSKAYTTKPKYLVIVASASKFGDYFCGSKSSVMYLDDFELIYE